MLKEVLLQIVEGQEESIIVLLRYGLLKNIDK